MENQPVLQDSVSFFQGFSKEEHAQSGMTIIEILIVIALIGTIMTIVISNLFPSVDASRIDLTRIGASNIGQALYRYRMDNNKFPSPEAGLRALVEKVDSAQNWRGPYIEEDQLVDAWQRPYQYELPDALHFKIRSVGLDGEAGNEDDIIYPKDKKVEGADDRKRDRDELSKG